jgi:cell division protein FtsB
MPKKDKDIDIDIHVEQEPDKEEEKEEGGWRLEDDADIKKIILDDQDLAKILSIPPPRSEAPLTDTKRSKRRVLLLVLLVVAIIVSSFVLGVLYSQNTQLKNESSKLAQEQAGLTQGIDKLKSGIDRCQEELKLCVEDVDMLSELSAFDLSPKKKYGSEYNRVKKLQEKKEKLIGEREQLQTELEGTVSNLWRPADKPKKFWRDLRGLVRNKRKTEKRLRQVNKTYDKATSQLESTFFEKRNQFVEKIKTKNEQRRKTALGFEIYTNAEDEQEPDASPLTETETTAQSTAQ